MRVVIISDTHNKLANITVPDGDVLIHCGDFCGYGKMDEVERFNSEFAKLPHKHKIVIAGNHDFPLENQKAVATTKLTGMTYLEDSGAEIDGVKIWGSPWQPEFMNWAFNLPRCGDELQRVWAMIPDDVDILVTHGPPYGILDRTKGGDLVGCELLRARVDEIKPRVHCFGHIHEAYGTELNGETLFINASNLNLRYQVSNEPIVVDLSDGEPAVLVTQ